jgi:hypothetical protein
LKRASKAFLRALENMRRADAEVCKHCKEPRSNWRHKPSVVFDGRPAHEFEPASTPTTTTKGEP